MTYLHRNLIPSCLAGSMCTLTDEGLKGQIWEPLCKEYSGTTARHRGWLREWLLRRMNTPEMYPPGLTSWARMGVIGWRCAAGPALLRSGQDRLSKTASLWPHPSREGKRPRLSPFVHSRKQDFCHVAGVLSPGTPSQSFQATRWPLPGVGAGRVTEPRPTARGSPCSC